MTNSSTFYIVRHGKTEWNKKGFIQGHKDSKLTHEGEAEAYALGKELKDIKFDLVFSSDLLRAKRTAEIIALEKKLAVETTKLLRERSFGSFEGKHYSTLSTYDMLYKELGDEKKYTYEYEDVESDERMLTRIITFLRETAIAHPSKKILVVTHGNIMYELLVKIGFGTHENFPLKAIGNTGYFVMESDGVDFEIIRTSRITHPTPLS